MIKKILSFIILIFMALQIPVYAVEEKPPIDVHIPIQVRDYGGTCALLMEEDGTIVDSVTLDANDQGEFVVELPYQPETYVYKAAVVKTADGITPDSNIYTVTIFVSANDFNEDLQYSIIVMKPDGTKPDKLSFTNRKTSGSPQDDNPPNPGPTPTPTPGPSPTPDPGKPTPTPTPTPTPSTPTTGTPQTQEGTVKGINRQVVVPGTQTGISDSGGVIGTRKAIATGDDSNLYLYLILCAVSGAAMVILLINKRRKYYEE